MLGGCTYYTRLTLNPLPAEGAERLLAALLGSNAGLEPLTRVLIAQTEGNPFFLEESVRTLVETGALTGERGAYQLARPLPAIQVPATVQAVIAARIDRLCATDKTLLQTASVLGKDVPLGLLQAIAEVSEDELHAALRRLQAAEFLYEVGFLPDIEYTFKHALTHEVAYSSLLQDRRRALHVRIVETIERTYPDRLAEHVERLAHHAFLGEDWAKAVTYLQQAGAKAFARSVHREAVRCFEEALTALTHLPETRETLEQAIDLRFDLRNALLPLVEWGRIEEYLREAEALARKFNDQRRLASVSGYMSGLHLNTGGRASDVRAFAEEVEAIGASLRDVPLQVAGGYYHVWLGTLSGDYHGTERLCRHLIDALPGDLSRNRFGLVAYPAVVARAFLARALAELGMFDEGREHGEEAVRLAESLDHQFSLIWACLNLGRLEEPSRRIQPGDHAVRACARCLPRVEHRVLDSDRAGGSGARLRAVGTRRGRRLLAAASLGRLCVRRNRISALDEHGAARRSAPPRRSGGGSVGVRHPCRGARARARGTRSRGLGPSPPRRDGLTSRRPGRGGGRSALCCLHGFGLGARHAPAPRSLPFQPRQAPRAGRRCGGRRNISRRR